MNFRDNSDAAFPSYGTMGERIELGMTLRDAMALAALPATSNLAWRDIDYTPVDGKSIMENMALLAYKMADAMLAAREA